MFSLSHFPEKFAQVSILWPSLRCWVQNSRCIPSLFQTKNNHVQVAHPEYNNWVVGWRGWTFKNVFEEVFPHLRGKKNFHRKRVCMANFSGFWATWKIAWIWRFPWTPSIFYIISRQVHIVKDILNAHAVGGVLDWSFGRLSETLTLFNTQRCKFW